MIRKRLFPLFFLAILHQAVFADDAGAGIEARLRGVLRDTMGQLRDAQSQLAVAQAAQAQSDKDKAELQAKVEALTGQLKALQDQTAADKAAAEKTVADLKQGNQALIVHMVDALTAQINALGKSDDKTEALLRDTVAGLKAQNPDSSAALDQYGADIRSWVAGYNEYVELESKTEAQRAKLAALVPVLRQTVADREAKNLALYQLGNEILTRYEKFGLGDALGAKEPFAGLSRVKLENLVQGYQNSLRDQIVIPGQPIADLPRAPGKQTGEISSR